MKLECPFGKYDSDESCAKCEWCIKEPMYDGDGYLLGDLFDCMWLLSRRRELR